jgi:hypothetical protein
LMRGWGNTLRCLYYSIIIAITIQSFKNNILCYLNEEKGSFLYCLYHLWAVSTLAL